MASSGLVMCGSCKAENKSTNASLWCNNCEEGLCSICSNQHKKFKTTRDHKTIDIEAYTKLPLFIRSIKTDCERHERQLLLYCPNHLTPCCEVCVSSDHSKCLGIKAMPSVVEQENLSESVHSLEEEMKSILIVFEKIVSSKTRSLKAIYEEQLSIKENTVKIRKEMNEHLDRLETKLNSELSCIVNKEETREKDLIHEMERKKHNLQEMQQHMHLLLEYGSKVQSFLGIYHLTQQVHHYQQFLDDKDNDSKITTAILKMTQNVELKRLISNLELVERLGEILIVNTDIDWKRKNDMPKVAQEQSSKLERIGRIYFNFDSDVNAICHYNSFLKGDEFVNGLTCLTNGQVVLVIKDDKVLVLEDDGSFKKWLSVEGQAFGVTETSKNSIALTYPNEKVVKLINVTDDTITKEIKLNKQCHGLSYGNDSIAIGLSGDENKEIRVINLNGTTLSSIIVERRYEINSLVYTDREIILPDVHKQVISCYDMSGCLKWQIPCVRVRNGICTNKYGNIYATNFSNIDLILEVSNDGRESGVVQIKNFQLGEPWLICFSRDNQYAYVYSVDPYGNCLTKFQVLCK